MKSSTGVVEQRPIAFEQQLKASPEDAQRRIFLGLSLAYLGRKTDALREAQEGARMVPPSADATSGTSSLPLWAKPHTAPYFSPHLRPAPGNPRFERLVNGS